MSDQCRSAIRRTCRREGAASCPLPFGGGMNELSLTRALDSAVLTWTVRRGNPLRGQGEAASSRVAATDLDSDVSAHQRRLGSRGDKWWAEQPWTCFRAAHPEYGVRQQTSAGPSLSGPRLAQPATHCMCRWSLTSARYSLTRVLGPSPGAREEAAPSCPLSGYPAAGRSPQTDSAYRESSARSFRAAE
jgi:hypothetical protein